MAPAMKAMKAMKAKAGLTATGAFAAVAESTELKPKQVKIVITSYVELAASELKKRGGFQFGGVLKMKLKKKPAKPAHKASIPSQRNHACHRQEPAHLPSRLLHRRLCALLYSHVVACSP